MILHQCYLIEYQMSSDGLWLEYAVVPLESGETKAISDFKYFRRKNKMYNFRLIKETREVIDV